MLEPLHSPFEFLQLPFSLAQIPTAASPSCSSDLQPRNQPLLLPRTSPSRQSAFHHPLPQSTPLHRLLLSVPQQTQAFPILKAAFFKVSSPAHITMNPTNQFVLIAAHGLVAKRSHFNWGSPGSCGRIEKGEGNQGRLPGGRGHGSNCVPFPKIHVAVLSPAPHPVLQNVT